MPDPTPPAVLRDLRLTYLRSMAQKMTEFADALKARNFAVLSRLGHQLKGSGRSYAFPDLSEIGARLEDAAGDRRLIVLESMQIELRDLVRRLEEASETTEQS